MFYDHIMHYETTVQIDGLIQILIVNLDLVLEPPHLRYAHQVNIVDVVIARPSCVYRDSGLSSIIASQQHSDIVPRRIRHCVEVECESSVVRSA